MDPKLWKFINENNCQLTVSHNLEQIALCLDNKIYIQETGRDFIFREIKKMKFFDYDLSNKKLFTEIENLGIKQICESAKEIWPPLQQLQTGESIFN